MTKLSIIIPSRKERFLYPTVDDVLSKAKGEIEVVVVLQEEWPAGYKEFAAKHGNKITTIFTQPSMRGAINVGAESAISRGAKYLMKLDAHCSVGEGFDEILKAECDADWIVVPRRLRLEPESWTIAEPNKPPHDYHYLSFPDDPNDFGGAGLNGKPWVERQRERVNILVDEEMSSQGSGWFMCADYFSRLELMDEASYGPFWNEFQEIGLKCWLSGGQVMVNKKTHYAHLHKGRKYGRGYRLDESWLKQGRNHTMKWIWNEAWDGQTRPFEWLIDHFWPVPSWPENWRDILYKEKKPRDIVFIDTSWEIDEKNLNTVLSADTGGLQIIQAHYGIGGIDDLDVRARLQSLISNDSLDIVVNNSTLAPKQDPFRGQKKQLTVIYSYDGGSRNVSTRQEKEALIIGRPGDGRLLKAGNLYLDPKSPAHLDADRVQVEAGGEIYDIADGPVSKIEEVRATDEATPNLRPASIAHPPRTATALNDFLIRRFNISAYRLRAPMPIEVSSIHRNDLAALFSELGFTKGCEVGVAEGHFSEILCQSISGLEKLYCVDPWHRYSENPQGHSKEHHEYALNETKRRLEPFRDKVELIQEYSMDAVRSIPNESLDFVSIDGHHGFDFVMRDIIEWSYRVRSGGVILLDDFYYIDRKRWGAGVVEAVQAYTSAHEIRPWFICQGHRSVDAFWVRR